MAFSLAADFELENPSCLLHSKPQVVDTILVLVRTSTRSMNTENYIHWHDSAMQNLKVGFLIILCWNEFTNKLLMMNFRMLADYTKIKTLRGYFCSKSLALEYYLWSQRVVHCSLNLVHFQFPFSHWSHVLSWVIKKVNSCNFYRFSLTTFKFVNIYLFCSKLLVNNKSSKTLTACENITITSH